MRWFCYSNSSSLDSSTARRLPRISSEWSLRLRYRHRTERTTFSATCFQLIYLRDAVRIAFGRRAHQHPIDNRSRANKLFSFEARGDSVGAQKSNIRADSGVFNAREPLVLVSNAFRPSLCSHRTAPMRIFLSYLLCALRCVAWIERGIFEWEIFCTRLYVESVSCAMEEIDELCICGHILAIRRITNVLWHLR